MEHYDDSDDEDEADDGAGIELVHEVLNCPNMINRHHECAPYCRTRYGLKKFRPDSTMITKKTMVLTKYPLPEKWVEVADPGTYVFLRLNVLVNFFHHDVLLSPETGIITGTQPTITCPGFLRNIQERESVLLLRRPTVWI